MPIYEEKKCQNPIIIIPNMEIGALVKEMLHPQLGPTPYPHFHLPRKNNNKNSKFLC
jgi:hypothetical protein